MKIKQIAAALGVVALSGGPALSITAVGNGSDGVRVTALSGSSASDDDSIEFRTGPVVPDSVEFRTGPVGSDSVEF